MADIFFNMFGGKRWKVKTEQRTIQGKRGIEQSALFGTPERGRFGGGGEASGGF